MEANEIHETIAGQIHNMKPADLTPGTDLTMAPLAEHTLLVRVLPAQPNDERSHDAHVYYDRGRDTYVVTVYRLGRKQIYDDVYCDQLGSILFGDYAEEWSLPFGGIIDPETGETIAEW